MKASVVLVVATAILSSTFPSLPWNADKLNHQKESVDISEYKLKRSDNDKCYREIHIFGNQRMYWKM